MAKSRERQSDRHYITFPSACCIKCSMWCWKMFKWFPVLLISAIVGWSYYAYVIQLCIYTVENPLQQIIYLIVYHISLIMFLWAYARTIFARVGPLPDKFKLSGAEVERLLASDTEEAQRALLEEFAKDLPIYTRTSNGSLRYCNRCVLIKPDRAHHCSICSQCVLKMDHHCPWVNNCVCFHNYKFFILFLGYALIYCTWIWVTCFPSFISFWRGEMPANILSYSRYHVVFAFFVGLMFGISIGTLFIYHCYLAFKNRTTLESFRAPSFRSGPDKNGFSLGGYKNFKQVFGDVPHLWLLPVFTSQGDGVVFPLPHHEEDSESLLNCEIWDRWEDRRRQYDANVDSSSYDEL